jgi:hypothetical protein
VALFGRLGVVRRWMNKISAAVIWAAAAYLAGALLEGLG